MSALKAQPAESVLAQRFISRTGSISPTVLRLGGGDSSTLMIKDLEAVIAADPEFSLRALALANSAFYSQQYEINSLRAALVVLGVDVVHNLAASLLAHTLHASPTAVDEPLWQHCQAVGVAAQLLSETHQQTDPKQAFAAGLLHDIGLLALQTLRVDDSDAAVSHAVLGADIAKRLGLSASLVDAIRNHSGASSPETTHTPLQATLYLANTLAEQCGFGIDCNPHRNDRRLKELTADLGLTDADLDALVAAFPARLSIHHSELSGVQERPA